MGDSSVGVAPFAVGPSAILVESGRSGGAPGRFDAAGLAVTAGRGARDGNLADDFLPRAARKVAQTPQQSRHNYSEEASAQLLSISTLLS